ncbi:integrator complex subunit 4-like [Oscarella lobularis]|uniref:integrator complex subunit 4-like n=1 Tax=Oscarella lobularis TaxID=121494 RepID=UPI0033143A58
MATHRKRKAKLESYSNVISKPPEKTLAIKLKAKKPKIASESSLRDAAAQINILSIPKRLRSPQQIDEDIMRLVKTMQGGQGTTSAAVRASASERLASLLLSDSCSQEMREKCMGELVGVLNSEDDGCLRSSVLGAIARCIQDGKCDTAISEKEIHSLGMNCIQDGCFAVRVSALHFMTSCWDRQLADLSLLKKILAEFVGDPDSRVRKAALEELVALHSKEVSLELAIYPTVACALKDDDSDVRVLAVELVHCIAVGQPDTPMQLDKGEPMTTVRLIDDAFMKTCGMMSDLAANVRTEAARLLGLFTDVSFTFLEQTLDKKLMSHMKTRKSYHEKRRDGFAAGNTKSVWSSGRDFGADAAKKVDSDECHIVNQGACGAFIHGLEDEFLEVRTAAVKSMCQLSTKYPKFAALSLDFQVDMFNDEIDSVRLTAIDCLCKVIHLVELEEDQLETVLGILPDCSSDIREAIRDLLANSHLTTKSCLNQAIQSLLTNLNSYPQDRPHIWKCMKSLGDHHSSLAFALVKDLLNTHPYFVSQEPDADDPAYIGILILVFSAMKHSPLMVEFCPQHTIRHYSYLRDSIPDLVPDVQIGKKSPLVLSERSMKTASALIDRIMGRVIHIVQRQQSRAACVPVLETAIRDFEQVATTTSSPHSASSATWTCISMHLRCLLYLYQAFEPWQSASSESHRLLSVLSPTSLNEFLRYSYSLQHLFCGLTDKEQLHLRECRVLLHAAYILQNSHKIAEKSQHVLCLLSRLQSLERFCKQTDCTPSPHVKHLLLAKENIYTGAGSGNLLQSLCGPLEQTAKDFDIKQYLLSFSPSTFQRTSADILLPRDSGRGSGGKPKQFVSALAISFDIEAILTNVTDIESVCIQVLFPDGTRQIFYPKAAEIKKLTDSTHRLRSTVVLSHSQWSEACDIEISIARSFTPDVDEFLLVKAPSDLDCISKGLLNLSGSTSVSIQPKDRLYR